MNKILVRIFIGLASLITVLGLFVTIVVDKTNEIRYEHFVYDLVKAPLELYAKAPFSLPGVKQVTLNTLEQDEVLSEVEFQRLNYGQVVLVESIDGYTAFKQLPHDLVAFMSFNQIGAEVYSLYAALIRSTLSLVTGEEEVEQTIDVLSDILQLKIVKLDEQSPLLSQSGLDSLFDKGEYHLFDASGVASYSFVRVGSGQVLKLEYLRSYSSFSWWLFFFLLLMSVGLVMLVAYYFVEGFSRRLRAIESVASRLSRGELEARVANASDEDAISRLGLSFNAMADHIQRLMMVQKEMIHAVSHELRTPVARIRFGVQMIEDCPSAEAMNKQIRGIDGDIQELDELIDEILTYARLEQGGPILAFQEADVSALVEQVVSEQSSVKPDMEIFAEYKDGSDVWKMSDVEARYIHRSIQNLVGNATRYAAGKVKVVCAFDKDTCRVDVEDDGPGIPEEQWESVFTPFARLDDSRTRSSGGYGLGLSIVRRILYWHGGQAFLGRSDMGGAKFSLVWPRRQAKES